MHRSTIDRDGCPVWNFDHGEPLACDVVAWDRLGVGTRCETWLGWSTALWCPAVVKMARPHQCDNPRARLSLEREITALQDNPHPVLPRLIAADLDAEAPYIVIEYIDGESLDAMTEDAPLDWASTAMLGIHLLSAVTALHGSGVAHLDIKPENVVIRNGRPTLVDFGSARPLGRHQPAGHPVGTLGYAAPEMEACRPISTPMDVYSIGATLREALTGLSPYDVDPDCRALAAAPFDDVLHPRLTTLIAAMLAPRAGDRPTVPAALEGFADLFDVDERPWPAWIRATQESRPQAG